MILIGTQIRVGLGARVYTKIISISSPNPSDNRDDAILDIDFDQNTYIRDSRDSLFERNIHECLPARVSPGSSLLKSSFAIYKLRLSRTRVSLPLILDVTGKWEKIDRPIPSGAPAPIPRRSLFTFVHTRSQNTTARVSLVNNCL